jgi:hypothetical protein
LNQVSHSFVFSLRMAHGRVIADLSNRADHACRCP